MSSIHPALLIIVAAAVITAGCFQPTGQPAATPDSQTGVRQSPEIPAVNLSVPFAPVPVASPNGINIAYEIELSGLTDPSYVVEKVEVIDALKKKTLYSPEPELLAFTFIPAADPAPTAEELKSGTGKVPVPRVTIWFTVSPDVVPDHLTHRVVLNSTTEGQPPVIVTGGNVAVRKDLSPVIIGSPVHGPGWTAIETTSPTTHHFHAQVTMNGVTRVPQRYAQDWIYLDPVTGQAAEGDAGFAKNYLGYGRDIYSVAEGTVVDVMDGLPDVEKIYSAPPATIETMAGNYVIVDLGNRKYACYAHMVPGSIRVKKGDTVKEGQVLGRMGNSGNSDLPHLHFQVVTGSPSFLGAEGYPHVYRSFDVIGTLNQTLAEEKQSQPGYDMNRLWGEIGDVVKFSPQRITYNNMLPENNAVVRLP